MSAWVVGRSGLLGSNLEAALRSRTRCWHPQEPYAWSDTAAMAARLADDGRRFLEYAGDGDWLVAWCAGRGTIGASEEQMREECRLLEALLDGLGRAASGGAARRGAFFFASSAGAIWGAPGAAPIDEYSPPAPISAYGRGKLAQEELVAGWAARSGVRARIARITTLYGPQQRFDKGQGLITMLCRSQQRREPLNVYVPLSTTRNYLFAADAATCIVRWLAIDSPAPVKMKIVCAPRSTSIATVVRTLHDIARRRPLVSLSSSPRTSLQSGAVTFVSRVDPAGGDLVFTPLAVGLRVVHDAVGGLQRRGQLR